MQDEHTADDVEVYRDDLNDAAADGSGCAEMWSTLSDVRSSRSSDSSSGSGRRNFIGRLAVTLGVVPLGMGASVSASDREESADAPETEDIDGALRTRLVESAMKDEKVAFATEHLGSVERVASVFEYTLQSGTTGYCVTLGADDEADGKTVRYYESDAFDDGTAVVGSKPAGDGVISVDADTKTIVHALGTPTLERAVDRVSRREEYQALEQQLDEGTLLETEAVLVRTPVEDRDEIVIPVEEDDEIVDRLVVTERGATVRSDAYEYGLSSGGSVHPLSSTTCGAICGVLAAASTFGCMGVCLSNPTTAPFAHYCGTLCNAVAGGTCIPTCNDLL